MSRVLPPAPHPEHLRKEAKAVLKAHRRGSPTCCAILRHLHHFQGKPEPEILATPVSLSAVQFALAMDYGFTTWPELVAEVEARTGAYADGEPVDAESRFSKAVPVHAADALWLEPIPRYPYTTRIVDEHGNTVRHVRDRGLNSRIVGNLYCAMNMGGHTFPWPEVVVASGEAFRFAFERRWAQDAEYVTDVSHFAQACETLGFAYEESVGDSRQAALALIDQALSAGRPALISGWGERFWRVVVGLEHGTGLYRCIGGAEFEGGIPMADVGPGEALSEHMAPQECPACAVPAMDWHGAVLGPEQVALNPVFVVGDRVPVPEIERIRRVLQNALPMNRPYRIPRRNLEMRKLAIAHGPAGHDGWKFYFSPWEGEFEMGSGGLRAWADRVEAMAAPVIDFEMVHGIDTTFGGQLRPKARDIIAWLRWAEPRVPAATARALGAAREHFARIARISAPDLGLVRTVPCFHDSPLPVTTRGELGAMLAGQPALIYLISDAEKELLGAQAPECFGSPWGWRVLPQAEPFARGKEMAAANLRRMAEERDGGFAELANALATL